MPSRDRYRELLEGIREAHARHALAWQKARSKFGTNRKAHEATEKELEALRSRLSFFYETVLAPLANPFLAGDPAAINEVLNFLEVDVPAFRTGYSKEWYYGKLKSLKLDASQIGRLKEIAVKRCQSPEYRREDSELRRLIIRLADIDFLRKIAELPDSPNPHVKRKKYLMLEGEEGSQKGGRAEHRRELTLARVRFL